MIVFAVGVFFMVGVMSSLFGKLRFRFYVLATVVWTTALLVAGLPT